MSKYSSASHVMQMQSLRQEGLSNQAIADKLGCSYYTVLRYLGKQPLMSREAWGSQSAKVTDAQPSISAILPSPDAPQTKQHSTSLKTIASTTILEGSYHQFKISSYGNISIRMKEPEKSINLDEKGMEAFITELLDAYAALCEVNHINHVAG